MASIELALLALMLFLCHRRYRTNEKQQVRARNVRTHPRENPFSVDLFAYSDPRYPAGTVSRKNSWKKYILPRVAEEQVMDHRENGFSTQRLNKHRDDIWDDTPYNTRDTHLAELNLGTVVDCRDGNPEDRLVRRPYKPKPKKTPRGGGTTKRSRNNSLVITPSRAYFPTPGWRRFDEVPPSTPIYLDALAVARDNEPDHQLPTPPSIARPKTAICPNQSHNWGPSANEPCSYMIPAHPEACMTTPPGSEDNRCCLAVAGQKPPFDGLRQSLPPPIPPKSPFRKASSTWTTVDVSFLTSLSPIFLPSFEHSLTTRSRLQIRESKME